VRRYSDVPNASICTRPTPEATTQRGAISALPRTALGWKGGV
jgi:hypothetical protein